MKKRKLLDERGRLFGVISAVDILAVLLAAALAVMAYMRFFSGGEANVSDDRFVPVTYQIRLERVREFTARAFREGDRLLSDSGEDMGVIRDIQTGPAVQAVSTTDGQIRNMTSETYVEVILTVTADGSVNGDRYYAGRTFELGVNGQVNFTTKYVSTSGVIWDVDERSNS